MLTQYETHDLLVLVSLFSGTANSKTNYELFRPSFEHIKLRIVDRGTLLWTEPGRKNRHGMELLKRLAEFFEKIGLSETSSKDDRVDTEYNWYEPFGGKTNTAGIGALIVRRAHT